MSESKKKRRVRTIWISDTHLGTRGCKAEYLTEFLKSHHCENLYLVGDIIDGWRMRKSAYWPQSHSNVIRRILTMAKRETTVTYVTGNHDEFLRKYSDTDFGNIHLVDRAAHLTRDGRRLLIVHGDEFDVVVRYHKWLAILGDKAYEFSLLLNRWFNYCRQHFGYGYWSLSGYLKHRVKQAVSFIGDYEQALADECKRRGYDGIVCGHIHHAEIRRIDNIDYYNCGDWVESCTALIEDFNGHIELVHWTHLENETDLAEEAIAS
ncbi:MAG: UDP-2,3-diacylglucosamine diphosphatase [Gammaproteobacteria bacterium]|nr:UDP-2,3-diacylglucosamine diphosphatase [Gammaproteobacteria bacterium]